MGGKTPAERYKELGLADALSRDYDYSSACHELGLILRLAYAKIPKPLQSVVLRDTLAAFRLLPQVQTGYGVSSATVLLQAAEVALPKQKKALAVSEFKHAVVAHKRRCRTQLDGGLPHLPHDLMVYIFSYLDLRSLLTVTSVCWAWNSAASDNSLWEMLHGLLFGKGDICRNSKRGEELTCNMNDVNVHKSIGQDQMVNWKEAFKRKYIGERSWRLTSKSNRGICAHCKSIIWLSSITSVTSHNCTDLKTKKLNIRPISPTEVVDYIIGETDLTSSDSDDSDSDVSSLGSEWLPKLWAYPRFMDSH